MILRLIGKLPLSLGRRLGTVIGAVCWRLKDRNSRTTLSNLVRCFPEKSAAECRDLAKRSVRETGKLAVEICQIWHKDKPWLDSKIVAVSGQNLLEEAVAQGKGVIVVAPHLGNWEILGLWLIPYAERCTYLYAPPRQAHLEPLMKAARERFGASIVPTNRRGLGELLKRLKNGEITGILPDQVPDEGSGAISQFYGRKAYTMTLIHGLVQRTGCSVVSGIALRTKGGFHIHISPVDKAIYSSDQSESLLGLNRSIENCIQMAPEQYQWEYKRFKRTGEKGIYSK